MDQRGKEEEEEGGHGGRHHEKMWEGGGGGWRIFCCVRTNPRTGSFCVVLRRGVVVDRLKNDKSILSSLSNRGDKDFVASHFVVEFRGGSSWFVIEIA